MKFLLSLFTLLLALGMSSCGSLNINHGDTVSGAPNSNIILNHGDGNSFNVTQDKSRPITTHDGDTNNDNRELKL